MIIAGSYGVLKYDLKIFQNKLVPGVLFYVFFICLTFTQLKTFIAYPPRQMPHEVTDFLNKYKDIPIIMDADFESSRVEPSIYLGVAYTGDFRNKYWEFLRNAYPDAYQYKESQNIIGRWDDVYYTPELFSKSPEALVYFKKKDSNTRYTILHNIITWGSDTMAHFKLVCSLQATDEYVYELEGNQNMAKAMMAKYTDVNFDFEKLFFFLSFF